MAEPRKTDGVVAVIPQSDRLLVIRRSRHVVAPRMFCFPGGHLEANETESEGLIRELQEELDLAITPVRRIWQSVTDWQVSLAWWLCESITTDPQPNPDEVESVHWFKLDELAEMPDLLTSNHQFLAACRTGECRLELSGTSARGDEF